MSAIDVRGVQESDLRALCDLLSVLHGVPAWHDDEEQKATQALKMIIRDERRAVLVAELDGTTAGTIDISVSVNLTRHFSPFAVIENFVVSPEWRRRGVGRALIDSAVEFASDKGCYKVQLVSARTREEAHRVYVATGFDADVSGYRRYLRRADA